MAQFSVSHDYTDPRDHLSRTSGGFRFDTRADAAGSELSRSRKQLSVWSVLTCTETYSNMNKAARDQSEEDSQPLFSVLQAQNIGSVFFFFFYLQPQMTPL